MKHLSFIVVALLLISLVAAGLFPQPIVTKVDLAGYPKPEGLIVQQTNLRTGLSYTVVVDESGTSLLDWSNLPYLNGDSIQISILACASSPECVRTVQIEDGVPLFIDMKVGANTPAGEAIKAEVEYRYVCTDGSIHLTSSECTSVPNSVVKEVVTERYVYVCQDGSSVLNTDDCPQDKWKTALGVTSAALVVLALGLGGLYLSNKRKYKWVPGYVKILESKVKKAEKLKAEGKEKLALKELDSVHKSILTSQEKYLK